MKLLSYRMGSIFIFFEFFTLPAFTHLGVQIVLLAMLLGMLTTGMAFDFRDGKLQSDDYRRFLGFAVAMCGVCLDYFGPTLFTDQETLAFPRLHGRR